MTAHADLLRDKIERNAALIGVIGLGYVGLPLCIAIGEAGGRALGFDIDPSKAAAIAAGKSYMPHLSDERIKHLVDSGLLEATSSMHRLTEPDAILICVPTPLTHHHEPDLSYVLGTVRDVANHLRPGQLIVLESTTFPGTTREYVQPILEESGLVLDTDFFLAFSPEREDPGNLDFSTARIPRIVGADGANSRDLAVALYRNFISNVIAVSSSATAEAAKITENIFRAVNIALVNELKGVFGAMDIDIWEVIDAAKTKPFGYMPFYPGPGLGGHCIPIDPFYLTWKAREFNVPTRFIELAGEINSAMPDLVVGALARALDASASKGLNGSRIIVLGVAYKKNVGDTRESPALRLMDLLEARGAVVDFYDPHVSTIPMTREHKALAGRKSQSWDEARMAEYDAALIATDHDEVDYESLARFSRLVVDTRNACARAGADLSRVVPA